MGAHRIFAEMDQTTRVPGNPRRELSELREATKADYLEHTDIRYGAARGWVDAIIAPHETREVLPIALELATRPPPSGGFRAGVFQV